MLSLLRRDAAKLILLMAAVLLASVGCADQDGGAESARHAAISFTDLADRRIELDQLPQKFIVANYIANFMMTGGAESLNKVAGMALDGWEQIRYGEYKAFTDAFPQMKGGSGGIASIGGYHDDMLNAELIVSLKPDVIIMSPSQFVENNHHVSIFKRAGIAVVVLDYHSQKLENHVKSTEILGLLLDRSSIAKEQNDAYIQAIKVVNERIAALPEERKNKKVYVELGNKGVNEYGNSYSNAMLWGAIVNNLGADNMGAGLPDGYGVLDKEFVIASDPDVIFIAGAIWSGDDHNDQMRMGFTVDEETAQARLARFADRPEWVHMKAVRNGEVYAVDHGSLRNMIDYVFTQFMAKALYPDIFADLDPEQTMHDFYETYLPELEYSGIFMMKLERTE